MRGAGRHHCRSLREPMPLDSEFLPTPADSRELGGPGLSGMLKKTLQGSLGLTASH